MGKYTKDMFIRNKFENEITNEWDIISTTTLFKKDFKENESEKEIILGYANALNCITNYLLKQNHSNQDLIIFRQDSLAIPFIFLARHTVELILKYICNLLGIEYKPKHGLSILWDEISVMLRENSPIQEDYLEDIKNFISVMEDLDCDGSHSRYSKDNKGKLYNEKPKFINAFEINKFIQNVFVNLVNSIKIGD